MPLVSLSRVPLVTYGHPLHLLVAFLVPEARRAEYPAGHVSVLPFLRIFHQTYFEYVGPALFYEPLIVVFGVAVQEYIAGADASDIVVVTQLSVEVPRFLTVVTVVTR